MINLNIGTTCDFNARHLSWGDTVNNDYGKILAETLDQTKYSICTSASPTFLCSNGSSHIDLSIISNNLVDTTYKHSILQLESFERSVKV